jgi:hypothetical protein
MITSFLPTFIPVHVVCAASATIEEQLICASAVAYCKPATYVTAGPGGTTQHGDGTFVMLATGPITITESYGLVRAVLCQTPAPAS